MYLQFECDTLQGLGSGLHDLLTSESASGEGDLGWTRVGGEHWTKIIATRQDLDDTWREELLSKFTKLQTAVWCEWRWLDDDWVASQN